MGQAPVLTANIRLGWRGLPGPNTSLLQAFVNYDRKKFCILDLGRRFNQDLIKPEKLAKYKRSSLFCRIAKKFNNIETDKFYGYGQWQQPDCQGTEL